MLSFLIGIKFNELNRLWTYFITMGTSLDTFSAIDFSDKSLSDKVTGSSGCCNATSKKYPADPL